MKYTKALRLSNFWLWVNFIFFICLMFIYFWERERNSMSRVGAEREGGTKLEAGYRLWAVRTQPQVGLEPTNREIKTWAKVRHLTDWATQVSLSESILKYWYLPLENISSKAEKRFMIHPLDKILLTQYIII